MLGCRQTDGSPGRQSGAQWSAKPLRQFLYIPEVHLIDDSGGVTNVPGTVLGLVTEQRLEIGSERLGVGMRVEGVFSFVGEDLRGRPMQ